ncbi:dTDP-4-dehydrorhamnose reductase [Rothia kristinae]|uniref:dTDP-4-dehydrorhamnose reductase n=1 Tax=Rothia kristinae TaxID=37923 RepID=UPI0007378C33|nr:dTDP-4-dehydrorhamnose reductase [Rothia kristinae]KTR39294.1 dTDP-4-dehydrorhamnose reductase [Rothia kristinae]KTR59427.1 dTDP-4-dehydrorhamnose reductase [Rothia kristinae]KTR72879.1 dTDP-4-dehydrorhamnose reductase [Rothia kristinae]KTR73928.1 dTDP-4-dehydrorhamnose reductase [Rothia kristinae]KTR79183.1 dTDP-4-dehydrorhamnose reductase [Rothia kristinae]
MAELSITTTPIPGLLVVDLPVHGDNRGWFKENWQREKMTAAGLPDFGPVQNNISFNAARGTTRGIHAEPWDKYVSVATGEIFGAWVDLRAGESFGRVFTTRLDPARAVFVPRGVGNAFQTLVDDTAYAYLVNDHWSADAQGEYAFLNLADETAGIEWPVPLAEAELSEKDRNHPRLAEVEPVAPAPLLITGATGQLGRELVRQCRERGIPHRAVGREELDLARPESWRTSFRWRSYRAIVNAAAHTAVDAAQTPEGRREAWAANATGVAALAAVAVEHGLPLVHVSTDYVFDGARPVGQAYTPDDAVAPLGVYGQSKAAGEAAVAAVPQHHIVRTSWVIGEGRNFVRTMASLAERGVDPAVVGDQHGRPTFTEDLAAGILHLLEQNAAPGIYHLSNEGPDTTWAELAASVYELTGHDPARVSATTTAEYFADKPDAAPRPANSLLDLTKLEQTGFRPRDHREALAAYLAGREVESA